MTPGRPAPRSRLARRALARIAPRAPELILVVLLAAMVAPVIASGEGGTAGADDEQLYHLRTSLDLADELPHPDLEAVHTATTPGFHLVLAVVARLVTDDRAALEAFGSLFSLAMVLVAYSLVARFVDRWLALLLTLPFVLSHYVLQSAAWLNTDNAAVLFVLLTLGVALRLASAPPGEADARRPYVLGGAYLFLAAWVRQAALWAAGPFVVAAALAGRLVPGLAGPGAAAEGARSARPVARAIAATLPALASLLVLAAVWGQLTPPNAANQSGTSAAALPFTLAIVGVFGPFFAACAVTRDDLLRGRAPVAAAAGGLLLALAAPTSQTDELQRRTGGGLWRVVESTPVVADRSLLIAVLAPIGAAILVALWRAAARHAMRRPAVVALAAVASLALAQAATVRTYQRYFEPMLLVLLALLAAMGPLGGAGGRGPDGARGAGGPDEAGDRGPDGAAARRRAVPVLVLLCALQLAGCATVVYDNLV
ncbi:MAG TPA: hypothetical protein VF520_02925 [Thermoleophilaceae bacterium]